MIKANSKAILCMLATTACMQAIYYYPQLPAIMASHFDHSGSPNGWQSKPAFFTLYGSITIVLLLIFSRLSFWMTKVPIGFINIPQREYWFAAERREQTIAKIAGMGSQLNAVILAFIIGTMQLVFMANLQSPIRLASDTTLLLLALFLVYVCFWSLRFFLTFRRSD